MGVEPDANDRGERTVSLNRTVAALLGAIKEPGESISDVFLRIAAEWADL